MLNFPWRLRSSREHKGEIKRESCCPLWAKRGNQGPNQFSGGEQQGSAMARALSNNPALFRADEPTRNLDSETGLSLMKVLTGLVSEGNTLLVMFAHDRGMANFTKRRMYLKDGRLVEGDNNKKKGGSTINNS